jgi:hypothetical protein
MTITSPQTRTALQLDGWTLEVEVTQGAAYESWNRYDDHRRVANVTLWKREGGELRAINAFGDASELAAILKTINNEEGSK